jgi:limonene 1,2-monooxygenase
MSPAGKAGRGNMTPKDRWALVEKGAKSAGKTANRDNWRIVTNMYLAETREQAWADVSAGILRETKYLCSIGFEPMYQTHPGQRYEEFTPESIADRRDWVIGTPDDAIAWIECKMAETGGFGGVMLTANEWTSFDKLCKSCEMFARYVMPRFSGHNATLQDEWGRIERRWRGGVTGFDAGGKPSNLWRS